MKLFKSASRQFWLMIILGGCVFFVAGNFYVSNNESTESVKIPLVVNTTKRQIQEQIAYGAPTQLLIPKINVDASVEQVGITTDGAMGAPLGVDNVAWYKNGARPGEIGSAVIDGHFGVKNGKASVFDNLHKLKAGDNIYVKDSNGKTVAFVVRLSRSYDPNADATAVFTSNDGKAHLNLITCEGVWDKAVKSYPHRLIVFADRE